MEISIRKIGSFGSNPAKIIDMTIQSWSSTITEDVTGLDSKVPQSLIDNLRQVADELEDQNNKLNELRK